MDKAFEVTWEQFRESILAGWLECIPDAHLDARAAWEHLLAGGHQVPDEDGTTYADSARRAWEVNY